MTLHCSAQEERLPANDTGAIVVHLQAELLRKDEFIQTQKNTIRKLAAKNYAPAEAVDVGSPVSSTSNDAGDFRHRVPQRKQQPQHCQAPHSVAKKSSRKTPRTAEREVLTYGRDRLGTHELRGHSGSSFVRDGEDPESELGILRSRYCSLRKKHKELKDELLAYSNAVAENRYEVETLSALRVRDCLTINRLNRQLQEYGRFENEVRPNERPPVVRERQSISFSFVRMGGADKPPSRLEHDEFARDLVHEDLPNSDAERLRDELMAVVNENRTISKRNTDLETVFIDLNSEIHVLLSLVQCLRFDAENDSHSSQECTISVSSDTTGSVSCMPIRALGAVPDYLLSERVPGGVTEQNLAGFPVCTRSKASLDALVNLVKKARRDVALKYGEYLASTSRSNNQAFTRYAYGGEQSSRDSSLSADERSGTPQLPA